MTWLAFSILSALSESARDTFSKLSSTNTDVYTSGFALHLISFFPAMALVLWDGIPALEAQFWYGTIAFIIITPLWTLLYMKALQISKLSKVIPLMACNPIFTALLGLLFKREALSLVGWCGIILIAVGIYTANISLVTFRKDPLQPIKSIISDKGALAMLGVAFLWSSGAHFGKMRVDGSSALFSTMSSALIGMMTIYLIALVKKRKIGIRAVFGDFRKFTPVGAFYFLASIFSGYALQTGSATYVFAVKRGSLISGLISGRLVFGERLEKMKAAGAAITLLGIVLISVA